MQKIFGDRNGRIPGWVCALLFLAFMLPGLLGREPWKPDEGYTLGLVKHILDTGDWVVPTLAGEPFMEKPPLFFLSAALFGKLFGGILPLIDAARLACLFWILVATWALVRTAKHIEANAEIAVIGFLGASGLIVTAHYLVTDLALIAGMTLAMAGLADRSLHTSSAVLLGVGTGVAFLSKGLLGPGTLGISALLLPLFGENWKDRRYFQFLLIAFICVLPFLVIWPAALWHRSPVLFDEWLWVNNFGRFAGTVHIGPKKETGGYFKFVFLVAMPILPFSLWTTFRERLWCKEALLPILLIFIVMFNVLTMAADGRDLYALPMLVPIALLGALHADTGARRRWGGLAVWCGFVLLILLAWYGVLHLHGMLPFSWQSPFERLVVSMPDQLKPVFSAPRALTAATFSVLFMIWWWQDSAKGRLSIMRAWAAGLASLWLTVMLLLLPWLAVGNDYRRVSDEIAQFASSRHLNCVASERLGEPQRALFDYYDNLLTQRLEAGTGGECDLRLVQYEHGKWLDAKLDHFQPVWSGSRTGDTKERFILWQRVK